MDPASDWLGEWVREVPDFPEPGVSFKDITPLLANADAFRFATEAISDHFVGGDIDLVLGMDARGFIFGATVACRLGCGFVPVRKAGKLPGEVIGVDYDLEYGTGRLEISAGIISPGDRVAIIDDVLATGGTAEATMALARACDADVAGIAFLLEIESLGGRQRLDGIDPHVLLTYG